MSPPILVLYRAFDSAEQAVTSALLTETKEVIYSSSIDPDTLKRRKELRKPGGQELYYLKFFVRDKLLIIDYSLPLKRVFDYVKVSEEEMISAVTLHDLS